MFCKVHENNHIIKCYIKTCPDDDRVFIIIIILKHDATEYIIIYKYEKKWGKNYIF